MACDQYSWPLYKVSISVVHINARHKAIPCEAVFPRTKFSGSLQHVLYVTAFRKSRAKSEFNFIA